MASQYTKISNLPSVTTILAPFSGYKDVPVQYLDAASTRGTVVHSHCAAIALGKWCPSPIPEYKGYVDSFNDWFEKYIDKVLMVEEELACPKLGYCGHPDFLFQSEQLGGVILIDIKTPISKMKTWGCQVAAYEKLINETGKYPSINRIGSLRLNKDGKTAKFDEFTDSRVSYFAAFYGALIAYRFFQT